MKKQLLLITGSLMIATGSLVAQTYLSQDFERGSMPAGWSSSPAGAYAVPCVTSTYFTPPAHTTVVGINDDAVQTAANPNSRLITPVINLSAATSVYLKYDAFFMGLAYQSI